MLTPVLWFLRRLLCMVVGGGDEMRKPRRVSGILRRGENNRFFLLIKIYMSLRNIDLPGQDFIR